MEKRLLMYLTFAVVAGIVATVFTATLGAGIFQRQKPGIEIQGMHVLPDFRLIDHNGNQFTLSSLKGKAVLIYFGQLGGCSVCPLTLLKFKQTIEWLGPDADKVAFIFVTTNPEKDTPEFMKKYLSFFHEKIIGLSGSPEEVNAVLKLYNLIITDKNQAYKSGNHPVDHYTLVIGADRNHVLRIAFTPEMDVEEYIKGVRWLLSK